MYNQGLANLNTIVNNKDLSSAQKQAALNDSFAALNDGLAVMSQIGGIPMVQSVLSFDGGPNAANGPSNSAAMNDVRSQLASWGGAGSIVDMIDNGASPDQINSALAQLRTTTTNPKNTAVLDPIIALAARSTGSGGMPTLPGQTPVPEPSQSSPDQSFSGPAENTGFMPLGGGIVNTNPSTGTKQVWQAGAGGFGGHYITVPA